MMQLLQQGSVRLQGCRCQRLDKASHICGAGSSWVMCPCYLCTAIPLAEMSACRHRELRCRALSVIL